MRFETPERPGWRDHRAELRQGLAAGRLPVIGLPGLPGAVIDGWETSDGVLTCVTVRYGDADSWLAVETGRWAGTRMSPTPPRDVLKGHLRGAGVRFADLEWTEAETPVTVDGRVLTARVVHAGADWWAARITLEAGLFGEIEVGLTAYRKGFEPRLGILPGAEIAEMLDAPMPDLGPADLPDDLVRQPRDEPAGEPHRLLVDVVLRQEREAAGWLAEGGPAPRLPDSWGGLWAAAVRRQADLSGQPEQVADAAVTDMLSQLTGLLSDAPWFREDAALRRRAISETLLYVTGLSANVPSRPAQQAWRTHQDTHDPATPADIEAAVQAEAHWLDAWHTWAARAA